MKGSIIAVNDGDVERDYNDDDDDDDDDDDYWPGPIIAVHERGARSVGRDWRDWAGGEQRQGAHTSHVHTLHYIYCMYTYTKWYIYSYTQ